MKQRFIDFFTLLTTASTLICCAIPALLVTLGLGATLAGALSSFPQLIWFSEHKNIIFILGFVLLALGGFIQKINQNAPCPLDVKLKEACLKTRKQSLILYFISLGIFLIGALFAFILPWLTS